MMLDKTDKLFDEAHNSLKLRANTLKQTLNKVIPGHDCIDEVRAEVLCRYYTNLCIFGLARSTIHHTQEERNNLVFVL